MSSMVTFSLDRDFQTKACGPNLVGEAISSDPLRHFVNNIKIKDLVEFNLSRKNHIG